MTDTPPTRSTTQDREPPARRTPRRGGLVAVLGGIVLAFRVAAYLWPSPFVVVPDSLALPLNALGLLFLGCGVWAWRAYPTGATRAFLVYGAGMGVHWGGTIASESPALETALLVFYVGATAAADGAWLDLALRFPRGEGRPARAAGAAYLLALATFLAVPIAPLLAPRALEVGLGLVLAASFLIAIAGGITFLAKWHRASSAERGATGLTPIVGAFLIATVANLLGDAGALPGPPQAWGIPYALVPLALARALTRRRTHGA